MHIVPGSSSPFANSNPSAPDQKASTFVEGFQRPRNNHLFVSNVRFWSMLGIVAVHSSPTLLLINGTQWYLSAGLTALFKFGTIGFFLISGFLLGERVDQQRPMEYFLRRVKRVFLPWLFWLGILCAVLVTHQLVAPDLTHHAGHGIVAITFAAMGFALFETAFWFVPNLLLCIAVLLIFRRHLYSPWLGAGLLLANLVYVVNIYKLWFPSQHTVALFAFVFYLWLGSYAAQNFQKISGFCARVPAWVFLVLSILSGAAAYSETCLLKSLHNPDPLNTLRLSNQIFSIFVVLLIFKFTRATWPGIVDVRRHTFGLYLTHAIVLTFLLYPLKRIHLPAGSSVRAADVASVALWATTAIGTYLICLGVTRWLAGNSSLEWMVGLFPQEPRRSKDRVGSESSDLIQV